MAVRNYRVYPQTVRGYTTHGFFSIDMDDATRKRYEASTPEEQATFLKFNATFHPLDVKINVVRGVSELERQ